MVPHNGFTPMLYRQTRVKCHVNKAEGQSMEFTFFYAMHMWYYLLILHNA